MNISGFELVIISLYIGFIAASAAALYERRTLGAFIRALIKAEAFDKERAKTLGELGFERNFAVKRALRGKGQYTGMVFEATEEPVFDREDHALPVYRERFDPASDRFYLPEVLKYRAEIRFEKKGSHIMSLVMGAIVFGVVAVLLVLFKDRIVETVQDWFAFIRQ